MTTLHLQSQPHNLEAEKTVLGALLIDPKAIFRIATTLAEKDFYDPVYGRIYQAVLTLLDAGRPIDFVTVADKLADDKKIQEIGGSAFLATLVEGVPTSSHVEHYATIVHDLSQRRGLIAAGQKIASVGYEQPSAPAAVEEAQQTLLAATTTTSTDKPELLASVADRRYDQIAQVQQSGDPSVLKRIETGYANIDHYFNGFAPGSLTVIAARPSMGKTALVTNVALNCVSKSGKRVLFFSLEMTKEELTDRITAAKLGVSTWRLEKGDVSDEQISSLGKVIDHLGDYPLFIDDDPDTTLSNLRSKALAHQIEHGLDLVIVDYLQLLEIPSDSRPKENRVQEISLISRGLKQLARQLDVPVIALSQLNRAVENTPKAIPSLSHLRESGSIEQDAHNVLMLWREGYYDEDCEHPDLTTVFVRKNRQGPVGAAELVFNKELMTFSSLDRTHSKSQGN